MKTRTLVSILLLIFTVLIITGSLASASDIELFFQAIERGNVAAVKNLLKDGVDVNVKDPEGYTALILAAGYGYLDILELLLLEGADINGKGRSDYTALMLTAIAGTTDATRFLINAGADIHAKSDLGGTALLNASIYGHTDIARLLMEAGADIEMPGNFTPLMAATKNGHIETTKLLLQWGADFSASDNDNITALAFAAHNGHSEIISLLIEKGANIDKKDKWGTTPLIVALKNGHTEVAKLLIEVGADINAQDNKGRNALGFASANGQTEIIKLLIGSGADVNAQAKSGRTALMLASAKGITEVVQLLIEAGADIDARDNKGRNAYMVASHYGHTEIEQLLIPVGFQYGNDKALINIHSGAVFEETYGDFIRVNTQKYDNAGKDVSVRYSCDTDSYRIKADIYVYPTNIGMATVDRLRGHYPQLKNDVFTVHKNVQLVLEKETIFNFALGDRFGILAGFTVEMNDEKMMSFLFLFGEKDWYILFRISYPVSVHGSKGVSDSMVNLVSSFDYSAVKLREPVGFLEGRNGEYIHSLSGIEFPKESGSFKRSYALTINETGHDVEVGYTASVPFDALLTIHVYPALSKSKIPDLDQEYSNAKEAIFGLHPDAKTMDVIRNETLKWESFKFANIFQYKQQYVFYQLILLLDKNWYVEHRVTWPVDQTRETSEALLSEFIGEIPLFYPSLVAPK